jgi:hypothetical protein
VETAVTVAVITFVIIAGMFLIHRLNVQHDERIGAFRYSDALPGIGRRNRKGPRATPHAVSIETGAADDADRFQPGGGYGRRPSHPPTRRP